MDIIDLSDDCSDLEKHEDEPAEIRGDEHELQQVDKRLEEVNLMLTSISTQHEGREARHCIHFQHTTLNCGGTSIIVG